MGRVLGKETTLQLDNHYHPMGEAASDVTRIGIHFGEGKLEKAVSTLAMANTGLRIPPGADHHAENAHYVFAADSQIVAFSPHMHVREGDELPAHLSRRLERDASGRPEVQLRLAVALLSDQADRRSGGKPPRRHGGLEQLRG